MKILIDGLWHLGLVTTAGLLKLNNEVICYLDDYKLINSLNKLKLPLYEKNLEKILKENLKKKNLSFTSDDKFLKSAKIYWCCYDTPVNDLDEGDTNIILKKIYKRLDKLRSCEELIISSQIGVGSVKKVEDKISKLKLNLRVTYIPENLRLGKAVERFLFPDRIIVGCRNQESVKNIKKIYGKIKNKIIFVKPESAEMIKHSINSFLANSICFINEITKISKISGADPREVSYGLKSDERIGFKSYLSPGSAYGGGTLGRDVMFLKNFAKKNNIKLPLITNINESNKETKNYLLNFFKKNKRNNKKILFLGLAYTQGTSTLRRSDVLTIINLMKKRKCKFYLHDPIITRLPKLYEKYLAVNLHSKISEVDTIIILYNHPFYKKFQKKIDTIASQKKLYIHDPFMILNLNKNVNYI